MSFAEKLANVVNRHDEIQALLSSPDVSPDDLVRMNKEISELAPVVEAIHNYNRTENDLNDAKAMMEDDSLDKEMREMAAAEYYELKDKLPEMEKEIKILLLPKEEDDEKTPSLKCARAPAATKRLCLRRCCLKCISAILRKWAGSLRFWTRTKIRSAVIRKLLPKLPARMFLPNSNLNPERIVFSACR